MRISSQILRTHASHHVSHPNMVISTSFFQKNEVDIRQDSAMLSSTSGHHLRLCEKHAILALWSHDQAILTGIRGGSLASIHGIEIGEHTLQAKGLDMTIKLFQQSLSIYNEQISNTSVLQISTALLGVGSDRRHLPERTVFDS